MECGDTPHFIISMWIQAWIWIQCMDLHGHSTLHNIHKDTNMDMDMEYGSTDMDIDMENGSISKLCNIHMDKDMDMDMEYGSKWSVETLYIP